MPYGRHGKGRRRGRMRLMDPIILLCLQKNSAHGYSLIEDLAEYGLINIDVSILYRALHQMEALGWVTSNQEQESSQGPPRRVYHITPLGENVLKEYIADLEKHLGYTQKIIQDYKAFTSKHL